MLPEQRGAGLAVKAVTVCDTLYCSVPPCHGGVAGHDSCPGMTHACLGELRQGGPGPPSHSSPHGSPPVPTLPLTPRSACAFPAEDKPRRPVHVSLKEGHR